MSLQLRLPGLRVGVEADSDILEALGRRFPGSGPEVGPSDVVFRYSAAPPGSSRRVGRVVYESPRGIVWYDDREDVLEMDVEGIGRAVWRGGSPEVEIAVDPASPQRLWAATRPLFTIPLMETYRRRGLFPLHASSVGRDSEAVLSVGGSGAGKTTLALVLRRHGYEWQGDDTALVSLDARGGVSVTGLTEEADVGEVTLRLLPELAAGTGEVLLAGYPKRQVSVPAAPVVASPLAPGVVLFPTVVPGSVSSLEPLPASEALLHALPSVLLTAHDVTRRHTEAVAALIRGSACYVAILGDEPGSLGDAVSAALAARNRLA